MMQRHLGSSHRRERRERGTALIEFALVIPFLILLTLSVVDLSRAFFVKNMLHQAAREGVRTLAVKTMADSADARARVTQVMDGANLSASAVEYLGPTNHQVGVRVQCEFNWLYPGLFRWVGAGFTNPTTLTAVAWMRKESP
jgi:Flp pilus assembly protein TadG